MSDIETLRDLLDELEEEDLDRPLRRLILEFGDPDDDADVEDDEDDSDLEDEDDLEGEDEEDDEA